MGEGIGSCHEMWVSTFLIVLAGLVRTAKHGLIGTAVPDNAVVGHRLGPGLCCLLLFWVRSRPRRVQLGGSPSHKGLGAGSMYKCSQTM